MAARTLGIILSLWLVISAFAFPRPPASFTNAWLVGLASGVSALVGMRSPRARFVETALSAWLVAAAFLLLPNRSGLAFWNDLAVGLLSLAVSLIPGTMYLPGLESRRAHA
jgi:hypothetical protein